MQLPALGLKDGDREGWEGECGGEGLVVAALGLGGDATEVADAAAGVDGGVAVEDFAPVAAGGEADAVVIAGRGG